MANPISQASGSQEESVVRDRPQTLFQPAARLQGVAEVQEAGRLVLVELLAAAVAEHQRAVEVLGVRLSQARFRRHRRCSNGRPTNPRR
jgi:hypothetical protein